MSNFSFQFALACLPTFIPLYFSLLDYDWDANFNGLESYVKKIAQNVLENGLPDGVVLNVNFPKLTAEKYKGIKVGRQARANWNEKFDKRVNPMKNQ